MGSLNSLHGKLIGVDTSPFIYFIERHPQYLAQVKPFFEAVDRGQIKTITSVLTLAEVLVLPIRSGDRGPVDRYTRILLQAENIYSVPVSSAIAIEAAQLRSAFRFKTPDAVHLATAISEGADAFLTNDVAFSRCSTIEVLLRRTARKPPLNH